MEDPEQQQQEQYEEQLQAYEQEELEGAAYDAANTYMDLPKEAVASLDNWEK